MLSASDASPQLMERRKTEPFRMFYHHAGRIRYVNANFNYAIFLRPVATVSITKD